MCDPWGTPDGTLIGSEIACLTRTAWVRSVRYDLIQEFLGPRDSTV